MVSCSACDETTIIEVSVLSVFSFVALAFVILRLGSRSIKRAGLEANDSLCIAGLVALSILICAARNTDDIPRCLPWLCHSLQYTVKLTHAKHFVVDND